MTFTDDCNGFHHRILHIDYKQTNKRTDIGTCWVAIATENHKIVLHENTNVLVMAWMIENTTVCATMARPPPAAARCKVHATFKTIALFSLYSEQNTFDFKQINSNPQKLYCSANLFNSKYHSFVIVVKIS